MITKEIILMFLGITGIFSLGFNRVPYYKYALFFFIYAIADALIKLK